MSTTDYTITTGRNGSRVHRATCKRAKNAVPLAEATPEQADGAVPASCCKPDAEQVGRALLVLSAQRPACSHPEAHEGHMALNGECPWCGAVDASAVRPDLTVEQIEGIAAGDDAPESTGEATVTVQYDGNGLPKGLFKPLATDAAERLAEATGVQVQAVRADRTVVLTGPDDKVAQAEQVVRQWWDWAYGAFREWKRTDEYRTMRQELPSKDVWQREQAWLGALDVEAVAR